MKSPIAILLALSGVSVAAFDKNQPWGKRDYSCVNVFQGIPDNSTVAPGSTIQIRFNREPTTRCPNPLTQYPGDPYSVWLYNNPVRNRDLISFDHSMPLLRDIPESDGGMSITIPADLPDVSDSSVWYLRVQTTLSNAPQVCSFVKS
ncbi:hypothetical protein PHISCL_00166 [Aspergillus sclerotialis]|uniref:Uncharacterized protein n=1 Tax=Aspergillus sclerotialis TaxID=2070753 RepID=A0A3A2ZWC1_9EURO|nr:hypothetical protein PHISCL_00166 [Aspergillus sclerotialis]